MAFLKQNSIVCSHEHLKIGLQFDETGGVFDLDDLYIFLETMDEEELKINLPGSYYWKFCILLVYSFNLTNLFELSDFYKRKKTYSIQLFIST